MKINEIDKHIIKNLLLAVALILGVFYFSEISSIVGTFVKIAAPLLYGFVIAYVLNIQ